MTKRNASATVFGWDFQINAAIVLMLDNITEAQNVRVEGKTEDIEILLSNGKTIYSQVKSVEESSTDFRNVRKKLNDAISSLSDAYQVGNSEQLVYITNSPNPFNDEKNKSIFYGNAVRSYDTLPEDYQKNIDKMISALEYDISMDVNQFTIRIIPFETNNFEERYKEIKHRIIEFLYDISPNVTGMGQEIMEIWQRELFENASTSKPDITVSKKELIWPIIVLSTDVQKCDSYILDEIDECDYRDLVYTYKTLINSRIERFEYATKIISDYQSYDFQGKVSDKLRSFIANSWENHLDEFENIEVDEEIKQQLIQIIMYNILKQKRMISDIKKKVRL
ncbi:hypothetical protein [Lachnotalea glycerini]|nr:hypothetical protein [Lachnotalea glycerini]